MGWQVTLHASGKQLVNCNNGEEIMVQSHRLGLSRDI